MSNALAKSKVLNSNVVQFCSSWETPVPIFTLILAAVNGGFALTGGLAALFFIPMFVFLVLGFGGNFALSNKLDNNSFNVLGQRASGYTDHYYWNSNHEYVPLPDEQRVYGMSSRNIFKRYMGLSKEDKRLFPSNLIDTLASDLTVEERGKVTVAATKVINEIDQRNALLKDHERNAKIQARSGGIDALVETLSDAERDVKIQTDTYKELL